MLKEGLSIDTTFNPPQFSSDYTFKSSTSSAYYLYTLIFILCIMRYNLIPCIISILWISVYIWGDWAERNSSTVFEMSFLFFAAFKGTLFQKTEWG